MESLDEILKKEETAKAEEEAQKNASEVQKTEEEKKQEEEVQKKASQLENLNKAIQEANNELKTLRTAKKIGDEEDDVKIDFTDPSSKAWDKHIKENVSPLQQEIEKEKEEIRSFALEQFLADKPSLASNPEKLKELVGIYEKIKTASERTKEGVLRDLDRAFAAVYHDELITQARESGVNRAKGNIIFSDPGVSRGSTTYFKEKEANPSQQLSEDDRAVLARWGMSPEEWGEAKKKYV